MFKELGLALCLFPLSAHTFAHKLTSYQEIYRHIENGKQLKFIIDFEKCGTTVPVYSLIVVTKPNSVMLRGDYLQFSNSPLTTNHPLYPDRPLIENVTYKVTKEGKVFISTKLLSLPEYSLLSKSSSLCFLNGAVKVYN